MIDIASFMLGSFVGVVFVAFMLPQEHVDAILHEWLNGSESEA